MTNFDPRPSRRTLMAGAGALGLGGMAGGAQTADAAPLLNPVLRQRADAGVFRHTED